MRRWLAALIIALGLLLFHAEVQAGCTSHTIFGPGGKVTICTICCYGGSCTTTCT